MSRVPFSTNNTKEKVFLLGGCGFVGIAFAKRLHSEGFLVFVVDVVEPPPDISEYAIFLPESIMNLSGVGLYLIVLLQKKKL
jgi:nucleoside-diphosphate-sugar epimerase